MMFCWLIRERYMYEVVGVFALAYVRHSELVTKIGGTFEQILNHERDQQNGLVSCQPKRPNPPQEQVRQVHLC